MTLMVVVAVIVGTVIVSVVTVGMVIVVTMLLLLRVRTMGTVNVPLLIGIMSVDAVAMVAVSMNAMSMRLVIVNVVTGMGLSLLQDRKLDRFRLPLVAAARVVQVFPAFSGVRNGHLRSSPIVRPRRRGPVWGGYSSCSSSAGSGWV